MATKEVQVVKDEEETTSILDEPICKEQMTTFNFY